MNKLSLRLLSLMTAFILLFTSINVVFAVESTATDQEAVERVQEIEGLRTTNSETYLLSDGSRESVIYAEDKYYKDDSDVLRLIDNAVVADSAATGRYKNRANAFDVSFSGTGVPEVMLEKDGASIAFSPASASGSAVSTYSRLAPNRCQINVGKVENCRPLNQLTSTGSNTVTYADAFTDTDLIYVVKNNALKEYIILGSAAAPSQFSFTYELNGLALQTVNNTPCFVDRNGAVVFSLNPLFAVDANGVFTDAVTYSYTLDAAANTAIVTVTLDSNYLHAENRAFPVIIDPTTTSSVTGETFVSSGSPTSNWNLMEAMAVGYDEDFYGICRSYLSFSIPSSLSGIDIDSATIKLSLETTSSSTLNAQAYRCTGSWTASNITWNTKPGYTAASVSSLAALQSDGKYAMNVTNMVQGWLDGNYSNYGVVLTTTNEYNTNYFYSFCKSDMGTAYAPQLVIRYYIDVLLMAQNIKQMDYHFNCYFTERNGFNINTQDFWEDSCNKNVETYTYDSLTRSGMIYNMQRANILYISCHGQSNSIQLSNTTSNPLTLTIDDLDGVDLSNLKFVLLFACHCAAGGIDGTGVNNFAEKLLACGADTVVAFSDAILTSDIVSYSTAVFQATLEGMNIGKAFKAAAGLSYEGYIGACTEVGGNTSRSLLDL